MPYRKVSYAEQMWYILKFKWKEVTRMPRKPKHPCHYPGYQQAVKRYQGSVLWFHAIVQSLFCVNAYD